MFKGLKIKIALTLYILVSLYSCANTVKINSYPNDAKVFVKDILTDTKTLLGQTPLNIKRTDQMSDVFFISIEKDDFLTRDILVKSNDNESIFIDAKLEPKEEKLLAEQLGLQASPSSPSSSENDRKKKTDEQEQKLKELEKRLALLDNTLDMYKNALFSQRYSGGERFTSRDNDKVLKLLFDAQKDIMNKRYKNANNKIDKALQIDEYLSQAYVLKGSIDYIERNFSKARINWERALEIDPYNSEVLKYLRRLYKRLGIEETEVENIAESFKKDRLPASSK